LPLKVTEFDLIIIDEDEYPNANRNKVKSGRATQTTSSNKQDR
jgi:hypothetical protein